MNVDIIPMTESHIPSFRECLDSVAHERVYIRLLEAPSLQNVIAFMTPQLQKGYPQFVAVDGARVVGWCDCFPEGMPGFEHIGRLGMGVLADYRHQGIGSRLMQATIDAARALGFEKIELEVYDSNVNAIAMYRKFGFQEEGVLVRKRKIDGIYQDQVLMGLFL